MPLPRRSFKMLIRDLFRPRKRKPSARRRGRSPLWFEHLEDRLAPAAHLLVDNGEYPAHVEEYTQGGTLVRTLTVPPPPGETGDQPRGLAQDPSGNIYVFNGTFTPTLATYNAVAGMWSQQTYPYWNTVSNGTYGGLAYLNGYVYASDNTLGTDPQQGSSGIVRFNIANNSAARFFDGYQLISLNLGPDGLIYALNGEATVFVIQPTTMTLVRTVQLRYSDDVRGVAVSATGDIFAANLGNSISHYTSSGQWLADYNTGHYSIGIDISPEGIVAVGTNNGLIYEMTTAFTNVRIIDTGTGSDTFVRFGQTPQPNQPPVAQNDSYQITRNVPFDSATSAVPDLLSNDSDIDGRPLTAVLVSGPSHGTLTLRANGSFLYTPFANYVGSDNFSY